MSGLGIGGSKSFITHCPAGDYLPVAGSRYRMFKKLTSRTMLPTDPAAREHCGQEAASSAAKGRWEWARHQHQGRPREQDANPHQQDISGHGGRSHGKAVCRGRDTLGEWRRSP